MLNESIHSQVLEKPHRKFVQTQSESEASSIFDSAIVCIEANVQQYPEFIFLAEEF